VRRLYKSFGVKGLSLTKDKIHLLISAVLGFYRVAEAHGALRGAFHCGIRRVALCVTNTK
jgi:hypothetical protein